MNDFIVWYGNFVCLCRTAFKPGTVFYMDNFAKCLPVGIPRLDTGVFRSCLWTAKGALVPPGMIGFEVEPIPLAENAPGVPSNLFSDDLVQILSDTYTKVDRVQPGFYDRSESKNVRAIPISALEITFEEGKYDGERCKYVPVEISEHNVGSNVGLLRNLKEYKPVQEETKSYVPVLCDINIFYRIMLVTLYSQIIMILSSSY